MEKLNELQSILKASHPDGPVSAELLPLVYDELRALAAMRLNDEKDPYSLQPTALVHDVWLTLAENDDRVWDNRRHFFRTAAKAMRNILVDRARAKDSLKRGRRPEMVNIEKLDIADASVDERVLLVDEMLTRLESEDPESVRLITLKFFGGLTNKEISEMDGVTERTVERNWAFAKSKLFRMIQRETGEEG